MALLTLILEHPWQFAVACASLSLLVFVLAKSATPPIGRLLQEWGKLLWGEFRPGSPKDFLQSCDRAAIIIFSFLCLLALLSSTANAILRRTFDCHVSASELTYFLCFFAALIVSLFGSPCLVAVLTRFLAVSNSIQSVLDEEPTSPDDIE